jgi:hypothetical protein
MNSGIAMRANIDALEQRLADQRERQHAGRGEQTTVPRPSTPGGTPTTSGATRTRRLSATVIGGASFVDSALPV